MSDDGVTLAEAREAVRAMQAWAIEAGETTEAEAARTLESLAERVADDPAEYRVLRALWVEPAP